MPSQHSVTVRRRLCRLATNAAAAAACAITSGVVAWGVPHGCLDGVVLGIQLTLGHKEGVEASGHTHGDSDSGHELCCHRLRVEDLQSKGRSISKRSISVLTRAADAHPEMLVF